MMKIETIYNDSDLSDGVCEWCGIYTEDIYTPEGICIDCIEEQKFYEMTMEGQEDD